MKKAVLAGFVLFGVFLSLSGCGKNAIELDKNSTVAFDSEKDKLSAPAGGPGSKGGPAMGGKGKKGAPSGGQ